MDAAWATDISSRKMGGQEPGRSADPPDGVGHPIPRAATTVARMKTPLATPSSWSGSGAVPSESPRAVAVTAEVREDEHGRQVIAGAASKSPAIGAVALALWLDVVVTT